MIRKKRIKKNLKKYKAPPPRLVEVVDNFFQMRYKLKR